MNKWTKRDTISIGMFIIITVLFSLALGWKLGIAIPMAIHYHIHKP